MDIAASCLVVLKGQEKIAVYNGVGFVKAHGSSTSGCEGFTFQECFLPSLTQARFLPSYDGANSTHHLFGPGRSGQDCFFGLPFVSREAGRPIRGNAPGNRIPQDTPTPKGSYNAGLPHAANRGDPYRVGLELPGASVPGALPPAVFFCPFRATETNP